MKLTQSDFILNAVLKGRRSLKHLRLRCTSSACSAGLCPSLTRPMLLAAAALIPILALTTATPALAAFGILYTVNSTDDSPNSSHDAAPGNGVCETATGNGVCTLRAAIEEANAHAGTDGIVFNIPTSDPGYNAQTQSYTISLQSALPALSTDMNITGPGAARLTVDGRGERIFNITTAGTVNLSGLTMADGYFDGDGGAIFNAQNGTVNITDSILKSNFARSGGAIANSVGRISVSTSEFIDNGASGPGSGGAIANQGTVSVSSSTFAGNAASEGGGIYNSGGTATFTNCTFYANIAYGDLTIGYGGAIFNTGQGILNLSNSTVTANFATGFPTGAGVFADGSRSNVKSTIIALNYGPAEFFGFSPDVSGTFNSQGFNLIGKKDGSTGFTAATDKKGTIASPLNPKFDPKGLRDNGGSTQTVALIAGSPAIDKGTSIGLSGTLTTDQRGLPRTVDKATVNATGGDGTDIGAFEFGAQ